MILEEKYEPKCFEELVFEEAHVRQILSEYATGLRDKHLLLYGSWGVGKSTAAKVIAHERCSDPEIRKTIDICSALDIIEDLQPTLQRISKGWTIQKWAGLSMPTAVINEVHLFYPMVHQYRLRAFMDRATHGRFIFTANNLHQLDRGFINRCLPVELKPLSPQTMRDRSRAILNSEKCPIDDALLDELLATVDGNWRDGLTALEDVIISQRR